MATATQEQMACAMAEDVRTVEQDDEFVFPRSVLRAWKGVYKWHVILQRGDGSCLNLASVRLPSQSREFSSVEAACRAAAAIFDRVEEIHGRKVMTREIRVEV